MTHKIKNTLILNNPAYVRMFILKYSKLAMYEFHYDYIKSKQTNKSRLFFTDTESLTYVIETENVYDDFIKNKEMFDFRNYDAKSKYYDDSNTLVLIKVKDEISGVAIKEFWTKARNVIDSSERF